MIEGVGKSGPGRIDMTRADQSAPAAKVDGAAVRNDRGGVESEIFGLVAGGPPVDSAKVADIRAAIAEGRYAVDPDAIAARMMALDLPQR
jgi:negative regulator of flagellin synthesis FlgM